jgi:nucleoid-associated protein YgaU
VAKNKKFSNTDFNLNMDMEIEMESSRKVRRDKHATEKYYNDNISRNVVGRLFDDYVRHEEKEQESAVITGYDDETEGAAEEYAADYAEDYAAEFVQKEEKVVEPAYMDYITSMSRSYQTERLRGLEQPESIKQYTQRQEIIKEKPVVGSEKYRNRSKRIEQIDHYVDEEYEDTYETDEDRLFSVSGLLSNRKAMVAVGGFVVIAIFSFLVFKINAVNGELTTATELLAENASKIEDYQSLRIENDGLQQQLRALQAELAAAESAVPAENGGEAAPDAEGTQAPTDATAAPNAGDEPSAASGTTYIVKPGDTFWSIAVDIYGDGNKSTAIMSNNNITTDTDLKIGAELLLP